jgi:hypothetical protein
MMILPSPGVLDQLIRERQRGLRGTAAHRPTARPTGLRLRAGRALIAAGHALSGERPEQPARPSVLSRTA